MTDLPRLAVVSDVVPCRTQGGELLLHRLLSGYPADRLTVVHGGRSPYFDAAKLLPGVRHEVLDYRFSLPAGLRTRWFPFWRAVELSRMARYAGRVVGLLAGFEPQAVLTVTDNALWRTAAAAAGRLRVPLHLIQHDDVASKSTGNSPKVQHRLTRRLIDREMGRVYRQAAERFCVSPGMAELYRARFGASARILYPSRGEDSPEPRVRVRPAGGGPPVVAFAGALYTDGAKDLLRRMADVLADAGGRLDLYTQGDRDLLRAFQLDRPNVRLAGFLPPREMAERMGETADALFLPASFLPREVTDVSTLFPSKLADYTAVGLPVLVWGPRYSSAVRWATEHPGAAVVVSEASGVGLREAVERLAKDARWGAELAAAAATAGRACFDLSAARSTLTSALRRAGVGAR